MNTNRTTYTYRLWIQGAEMANIYAKVSAFVRVIELVDSIIGADGKIIAVVDIQTGFPFDSFAQWSYGVQGLDTWACLWSEATDGSIVAAPVG